MASVESLVAVERGHCSSSLERTVTGGIKSGLMLSLRIMLGSLAMGVATMGCLPVAVLPAPEDYAGQEMTVWSGWPGEERVYEDGYVVLARFNDPTLPEFADGSLIRVVDGKFTLPFHWRIRFWSLRWFLWGDRSTWLVPRLGEEFRPVVIVKTFIAGHHRAGAFCLPSDNSKQFAVGENAADPQRAREYWQESFAGIRSSDDRGPRGRRTIVLSPSDYLELKEWVNRVRPDVRDD